MISSGASNGASGNWTVCEGDEAVVKWRMVPGRLGRDRGVPPGEVRGRAGADRAETETLNGQRVPPPGSGEAEAQIESQRSVGIRRRGERNNMPSGQVMLIAGVAAILWWGATGV